MNSALLCALVSIISANYSISYYLMFKSTVVCLLLSTIVGISFAQNREAPAPMDTVNIPANVQKNVEIYISRVTFDNTEKVYKPGQTLS